MDNPTPAGNIKRYVFAAFTFDVETGELTRNRHTQRIRRQTSRLLTILLERAGSVVTRDELRELLWPDGEHLDHQHAINRSVNQLRGSCVTILGIHGSSRHCRRVDIASAPK